MSTPTQTACGTCAVKSAGNCTSHLSGTIPLVAQVFIEAKVLFDEKNADHVALVNSMLAEDFVDEKGKPATFTLPEKPGAPNQPDLRAWYVGNVNQHVKAAGVACG